MQSLSTSRCDPKAMENTPHLRALLNKQNDLTVLFQGHKI